VVAGAGLIVIAMFYIMRRKNARGSAVLPGYSNSASGVSSNRLVENPAVELSFLNSPVLTNIKVGRVLGSIYLFYSIFLTLERW